MKGEGLFIEVYMYTYKTDQDIRRLEQKIDRVYKQLALNQTWTLFIIHYRLCILYEKLVHGWY
jgi:hypothetical protein